MLCGIDAYDNSAKTKITEELESFEEAHDWFAFIKETHRDSDRGCALLLGAMIEIHVEKLLRSVLIKQKSAVDPLFQYPGPLSTFGAKLRLAYCLRLLHRHEYRDLVRIQKIRNRFAHELHRTSFEGDAEVSRLCASLESRKLNGLDVNLSNRWLFWLTAIAIVADIDNRTLDPQSEERITAKPVFAET